MEANGAEDHQLTAEDDPASSPDGISWLRSAENLRSRAIVLPLGLVGIFTLYGGAALFLLNYDELSGGEAAGGASLLALGLLCMSVALFTRSNARAKFLERQERAAKEGIDTALRELENAMDLGGLMRINRAQMNAYENLARTQASSSYRLSQIAMGAGLLVVVGGCIAVLATSRAEAQLPVAGLTGIGALISGYLSRTYLRVYERTLQQLNFYFQQPLVSSYVLSAERLTEKMSGAKRNAAYESIIGSLLGGVGTSAETEDGTDVQRDRKPSLVEQIRGSTTRR